MNNKEEIKELLKTTIAEVEAIKLQTPERLKKLRSTLIENESLRTVENFGGFSFELSITEANTYLKRKRLSAALENRIFKKIKEDVLFKLKQTLATLEFKNTD